MSERLVILPRVDAPGDRPFDRDVDDHRSVAIQQLPHALVPVERRLLAERAARERQRMAATVRVPARGERRVASPREQPVDG
jgi:hypothetical protein